MKTYTPEILAEAKRRFKTGDRIKGVPLRPWVKPIDDYILWRIIPSVCKTVIYGQRFQETSRLIVLWIDGKWATVTKKYLTE